MYLRLAINVAISIIVIRKTNLHDVPHVLKIVIRIVISKAGTRKTNLHNVPHVLGGDLSGGELTSGICSKSCLKIIWIFSIDVITIVIIILFFKL